MRHSKPTEGHPLWLLCCCLGHLLPQWLLLLPVSIVLIWCAHAVSVVLPHDLDCDSGGAGMDNRRVA